MDSQHFRHSSGRASCNADSANRIRARFARRSEELSATDVHIPLARVHESAEVMRRMGGEVTERIYPGMGHTINDDEVKHVRGILAGLVQANAA